MSDLMDKFEARLKGDGLLDNEKERAEWKRAFARVKEQRRTERKRKAKRRHRRERHADVGGRIK